MHTRLVLIILALVWIGKCTTNAASPPPTLTEPCWLIWSWTENLSALVEHDAHRRALRPFGRSRIQRSRQGGGKRPFHRLRDREPSPDQPVATSPAQLDCSKSVLDPRRWGLTPELSRELPERLHSLWERYANRFTTKTRNTSHYAYHYLSGLLRLECQRNYSRIGRTAGIAEENVQHFMSNSPWSMRQVLAQVREELKATPGLEHGGVLLLDESADQSGDKKAGAGRQYNGRLGKVDLSQVGVFLAYANLSHTDRPLWTWIDGELYLQEHWFTPEMAELCERVGIPPDLPFETKVKKGWTMIQRAQAQGLCFEAVACDDLYGRSNWLRDQLTEAQILYMADVPHNTRVYLEKPMLGVPEPQPNRRGPKPKRVQVLNGIKSLTVHQVGRCPDTHWRKQRVRALERGILRDLFAVRQVWTLREGQAEPVAEWLVIRRESDNRHSYALSNAPVDTSFQRLAWLKCQRYFVERSNQDAKSEAGWDELIARKYRAWEHHLALVILAVWFVAQTKWNWVQRVVRDPTLARQFAVEVLPALSMANIRLLLRAAMPLPQPAPEQAVELVAKHLVNRTRSRASPLRRQRMALEPNANAPP